MTNLKIAESLALPVDAAAARYVILGKSGAGKTSGDAVLIEEFIEAGVPAVVLDPLGKMWGLRSSANGDAAGLPVAILGGAHGDVPLRADRGAYVADMLADGVSAVLDLSQLTHDDQCTFVADFLPRLLKRVRVNMHVAIEEAETFAPERTSSKAHARARAASTVFGRTARNYGIGWTFSTQKSQILSKEVIDAADVFIAMKMTGELAQAAIGAEVRSRVGKTMAAQIMEELPSLAKGHAWFIPDDDWLGGAPGPVEPVRFHFRWRHTFEVRAPKVGEERRAPRVLAPVDLLQLKEAMAADVVDDVDIDALKAQIADLQEQLKSAGEAGSVQVDQQAMEAAVADAEERGRILGRQEVLHTQRGVQDSLEAAKSYVAEALERLQSEPDVLPEPIQREAAPALPLRQSRAPVAAPAVSGVAMSKAERLVLTALAQYPAGRSKTQVAILTGYASSGGGFNNAISALRSMGYLEGGSSHMRATAAGLRTLGAFTPLPRGRMLLAHWLGQVGKAERAVLEVLANAYPKSRTKEQVAAAAGYEPNGGGFNNALSRLRTLELITGRGELRASQDLFG